jgi:hypothetical protein
MIELRLDEKRGCGWRQPGGLYLVAPAPLAFCGRLPIPLEVCPCCGQGIKPARGWTWILGDRIVEAAPPCTKAAGTVCDIADAEYNICPLAEGARFLGICGLLWIGEKFYRSPQEFRAEAGVLKSNGEVMGISRKIKSIPRGFVVGETRVFLAHRKTILVVPTGPKKEVEEKPEYRPGIFASFIPQAVEYVTKGGESPEEIESLERRGITPVRVRRIELGEFIEEEEKP